MKNTAIRLLNTVSIVLLCVAMCVSFFSIGMPGMGNAAWDGTVAASFASGSGTEANPYLIKTESQMGYFMDQLAKGVTYEGQHIRLENSLDMTGATWNYSHGKEFRGSFNGNGYTITADCPLFYTVGEGGTLKGLNYTTNHTEVDRALLCAYNYGTIDSCVCYGNVVVDSSPVEAAMICTENRGTVTNCGAVGSVKADGDDTSAYAAMIRQNYGTISSCYSALTVSASASGKYTEAKKDPLALGVTTGCYYNKDLFTGTAQSGVGMTTTELQSKAFLASLMGTSVPGTNWVTGSHGYPELDHCGTYFAYVEGHEGEKTIVSAEGSFVLRSSANGGAVYYTLDGSDPTKSTSSRKYASAGSTITVTGDAVLTIAPYYGASYGTISRLDIIALAGDGTSDSPYLISTKKQLTMLSRYPDKHFKVVNNITFTEDDYAFGGVLAGGWAPVAEFKGVLDGQGYAITGLQGKNGGMFETNSGTVTSLRLVDHKLFTYGNYGVIAENNSGTITRCYLRSAFTADSLPVGANAGANKVGGVAGSNTGEISYCHNDGVTVFTGAVKHYPDIRVGGICGYNGGTVMNCINTGTVILMNYQHPNNGYVGGIVGRGPARNCLSDTDFIIDQSFDYNVIVGGITGGNPGMGSTTALSCISAYPDVTTRAVSGYNPPTVLKNHFGQSWSDCCDLARVGLPSECPDLDFADGWMLSENGLVPQGVMDADGHCFVPNGSATDPSCSAVGSAPVKCTVCGLTKTQSVPVLSHIEVKDPGYDPTCVDPGLEDGTKCSRCDTVVKEKTEISATGEHTYENGFCTVCDAYEPAVLNNGVYEISNGGQLYWFAELVNGGETGADAVLTADITVNQNVLAADGSLNGDGSAFWVWTPIGTENKAYTGTFDGKGKTINGLYFNDTSIQYVGLFGHVKGGTVQNVTVADSYISAFHYVSAVVGCAQQATITNCNNKSSISGSMYVGGVVGSVSGSVTNCYNEGYVFASDEKVGGVVGYNGATITNCHNIGTVKCENRYDNYSVAGGVVGYNGKVVTDCTNRGTVQSIRAGGIAGDNFGTIQNCVNTDTAVVGKSTTGGIAGNNVGVISSCYNSGTLRGATYCGGIAGSNQETIINCFNNGSITGHVIGGIAGANKIAQASIVNCYSEGTIKSSTTNGSVFEGGIVGDNYGAVINSYIPAGYKGSIEGFGGKKGTVDELTSIKSVSAFSSGEVAYLLQGDQTEQVWGQKLGEETHPVFSPDKVYKNQTGGCTEETYTYTYNNVSAEPVVSHNWQDATCMAPRTCSDCAATEGEALGHSTEAEGDRAATCTEKAYCSRCEKTYGESNGSHNYENGFCSRCNAYEPAVLNNGVYEISNGGQLYWFAQLVNGGTTNVNAVLTKDIDLNPGYVFNADGTVTKDGTVATGNKKSWTPIGKESGNSKSFAGTFNGMGYAVSGIYTTYSSQVIATGLFGYVAEGGKVQNVGVENAYIAGNMWTAGVAGVNLGTVTNCYSMATVDSIHKAGGVVGRNEGAVEDCYNTGNVDGGDSVGGVVGESYGTITDCHNTGAVNGSDLDVGGVVGYNKGPVENCYNTGSVVGESSCVGGVVGIHQSGTVRNCYNSGDVTGNSEGSGHGGVIGSNSATVEKCYNTGNVTGGSSVGGVVGGHGSDAAVTNCYNTGAVQGSSYTGGVTGDNYGRVENCYSTGNIRGSSSYRGSVAGYNYGTIINCHYLEGGYGGIRDTNVSGSAEVRSEEAFASGEVANLLQGEQTQQVWGQKIGEETYPVFSADKVYKNQTGGCTEETYTYIYNNVSAEPVVSHNWQDATCMAPRTCSDCGEESGEMDPDNHYENTNTEITDLGDGTHGVICSACDNAISAEPHAGGDATCDEQARCLICQAYHGKLDSGNHKYNTNTEVTDLGDGTHGVVCSACDEAISAEPHAGGTATCVAKAKCTDCAEAYGPFADHTYVNGFCSVCDAYEPAVLNNGVYEISNGGQLYWFAELVNGGNTSANAILKNDITVNEGYTFTFLPDSGTVEIKTEAGSVVAYLGTGIVGDASGENTTFDVIQSALCEIYADLNDKVADDVDFGNLREWMPIETYKGTFEGVEHSVSGLFSYNSDGSSLFGRVYLAEGIVQNVGIVGSFFCGENVSAVVNNNNGLVSNCWNESLMVGKKVGGVTCSNYGTIIGCHNNGTIVGIETTGGIVGSNNSGSVDDCFNVGSVLGTDGYTSGVVAFSMGGVNNCSNRGVVNSTSIYTGGIVGDANGDGAIISNCNNLGSVNGKQNVGGIVGYITKNGFVTNCFNSASVSGTSINIGGVAGNIGSGVVTDCYNTGNVNGGSSVGGISGAIHSGVTINCYNVGGIYGSTAGGVAGYVSSSGTVKSSCSMGSVSGNRDIGGAIGKVTAGAIVSSCYYLSDTATGGINGTDVPGSAEARTEAQFSSGEVTYLLQGDQTEQIWGQKIGEEAYPVFSSDKVYKNQTGGCTEETYTYTYSNATAEPVVSHNWQDATCMAPQTCSDCDAEYGEKNPQNHTGVNKTVGAVEETCGEPGYTGDTVCECGVTVEEGKEIPAAGTHTYENGFCVRCDGYEPCGGKGTVNEPYTIANGGQLYWFAAVLNRGYGDVARNQRAVGELVNNIVVNTDVLEEGIRLSADHTNFRSWDMIHYYNGVFDGNGHSISGLYCNAPADEGVGMFYHASESNIRNLSILDSYFCGGMYVGSIVSDGATTTLYNCYVEAIVESSGDDVGGLAAKILNMENCSSSATVSGRNRVGGLAGRATLDVVNCHGSGKVTATGGFVGGLVGQGGSYYNCSYMNTVTGEGLVGGIVGDAGGILENCINYGAVVAQYKGGGMAGHMGDGIVNNCINAGSVTVTQDIAGGIVGMGSPAVSNCYSIGKISGADTLGGIVANTADDVTNCYYLSGSCSGGINGSDRIGAAEARTAAQFASGEVAYLLQGDQTEQVWGQKIGQETYPVFSADKVYKNQTGGCTEATYTYAYSNTQAAAVTTHVWLDATCVNPKTCAACGTTEGEALGHSTEAEGDRLPTCAEMGWCSRCEQEYGAGSHSYVNGFCVVCDAYEPAVLNAEGVYEISNGGQLYWFAQQVNRGNNNYNAVLTADIDLNPGFVFHEDGTIVQEGKPVTGGWREWTPIGEIVSVDNVLSGGYTGTFDGRGYAVSGIYFSATPLSAGLFGGVDSGGMVKNVAVKNAWIRGGDFVGGIVGRNCGTVANCVNEGAVSGGKIVGGVVGANVGGTVINCANTGMVSGDLEVGGVAGRNNGEIVNCLNVGKVTGNQFGGVVGGIAAAGTVDNCYYLSGTADGGFWDGDVSGSAEARTETQFASGEVAYLLQGDQTEQIWGQKIGEEAYPVFSADKVYRNQTGGCTEETYTYIYNNVSAEPVVSHNWQDATCVAPKTCRDCGASFGEPLADGHNWLAATCLAPETCEYCGLTRGEPIPHSYTNGFCVYCDRYEPCGGRGSLMDPYTISNAGQLYWFAAMVNTGYDGQEANREARGILTADITVNQNVLVDGELNPNHGVFRHWRPIGNSDAAYIGMFDGQNHTISGLYLSNDEPGYYGLFGNTGMDSVVRNVTIADSYFWSRGYVGGIAGGANGPISGCISYARVHSTSSFVGGIAGVHNGSGIAISDSINYGNVSGVNSVGGIVGGKIVAEIRNCVNEGNVSGASSVGGIIGHGGMIYGCTNKGDVTGTADNVGGIIGNGNSLQNCRNEGHVIGVSYVGGIAGNGGTISSCSNTGNVIGTGNYVGGVIGNGGMCEDIWNEGNVSGANYVGGVAGAMPNSLRTAHNTGTVTATGNRVGGVVGEIDHGFLDCCYNTGNVTGHSRVGGVVGSQRSGSATSVYNQGNVSGSLDGELIGGIVGYTTAEVRGAYNSGVVHGGSGVGGVFGVSEGTFENTYYLEGTADGANMGKDVPDLAEPMTSQQFVSGHVAWLLNIRAGAGSWGQKLGEQDYPVFSGDRVARNQTGGCTEDSYTYEYSNTLTAPVTTHDWETSGNVCETGGTCRRCGATNPGVGHSTMAPGDRAATCVSRAYCSVCQSEYGEINPYNHTGNNHIENAREATCTEEGYTGDTVCECGMVMARGTSIPVTEHDYVDGECADCGEKDPSEPTEPSEPSEPSEPTEPSEPSEPSEPTEPSEPSEPSEPTEPSDPTEPSEPSEPEEPELDGVIRLAGANRYLTGFAVANQLKATMGVEKFQAAVVAYGQNFPDALTGSYLAAVKQAPILLTEPSQDANVLGYLNQNLVPGGQIYILGGTAAVSQNFEDVARLMGFQVKRLKGAGRYETNLEILKEAGVNRTDEVLIATGKNYADSLSASATGLPMLLVDKELTESQKAFLLTTSCDFVILGGTGAVSAEIADELASMGTVTRVKGASRYGTSVEIAKRYFRNPTAAVLAYAQGFPDGLCGGPLALSIGAPLILTSNESSALADDYVVGIVSGAVTGGTARISDDTVRNIFDLPANTPIVKP